MSPPSRNNRRRRTSPVRAALPMTDAGFWVELSATFPLVSWPDSSGLLLRRELARLRRLGQGFDRAARLLDGRFRALGGADARHVDDFVDLTREDELGVVAEGRDDVGLLQGVEIDGAALDLGQLVEAHLGMPRLDLRAEADFRHPALDGHLAAFEADLVIATLAGALALHAAARGLALAGGGAASHAQARLARAVGWLHVIESHRHKNYSATFNRCLAA